MFLCFGIPMCVMNIPCLFHISVSWVCMLHKSPQVSRTLLSILADLSNAVVWIFSTHPPTSESSSPFINPLVTVQSAPITIGTTFTFMFYSFFNSLAKPRFFSFLSLSFNFSLWTDGTAESTNLQVLFFFFFFFFFVLRSGRQAEIR